jgi:Transposase IS66 family
MCGPEAELRCLRSHRAGPGAFAPHRPRPRGTGLLAYVLVSKYADHQPLYRQSEIYARKGVDLDRLTLAGWVGATSELLAPLVEAVRDHVMSASKLHADDTPVPVLAPGNGRTKIGRLWTYVRDDRLHPPYGSPTRPIARARTHADTSSSTRVRSRQTPMLASNISTKVERSSKLPAGLTRDVSSMRSTSRIPHLLQPKRSSASPLSMPSKRRYGAAHRDQEDDPLGQSKSSSR